MQNFAGRATLMAMRDGLAEFGRELERRRELIRPPMSANKAGRRAGITGQWWRQIERGLRNTPRTTVVRMANVIGWDPDEALRWAGYDDPATAEERRPLPPDPRDVVDAYWDKLTDRQRRLIAEVAAACAEPHGAPANVDDPAEVEVTNSSGATVLRTRQDSNREADKRE